VHGIFFLTLIGYTAGDVVSIPVSLTVLVAKGSFCGRLTAGFSTAIIVVEKVFQKKKKKKHFIIVNGR